MKVLFIGNSHTFFNDMVQTYREILAEVLEEEVDVTMLAYSGRSLKWHSEEYFALRFNLMYGNYDYCIIQQQAHPFPGYEETKEGLIPMVELCHSSGTTPILYMPWAEKRFPENQRKIEDAFTRLAEEFSIPMAEVGLIWEKFLAKYQQTELFWKDGEHAGPLGDVLIAYVLARKTAELDGAEWSEPTLEHARDFLQNKAVDLKHPRVVEDTAEVIVELEKDFREKIRSCMI